MEKPNPLIQDPQNKAHGIRKISLDDEVTAFVKQIDSLSTSLVLALKVMTTVREKVAESLTQFFDRHGILVEETDDHKSFSITQQHLSKGESLKKQHDHAAQATAILPRSFLVSLVSQFGAYLARLIRALYYMKPDLLDPTANTVSFAKLLDLNSIEAAREYLLEREIDAILRKSPTEQFAWLENRFGVALRKELMSWSTFIEVTERSRHFVHQNGVISSHYLAVCRELGIPVEDAVSVGDPLPVSPEYFDAAYRSLYEIGVKLAHVLWRKFKPEDLEAADRNLTAITHELIVAEKYNLAISLLDFASLTLKTYCNEEMRRTFIINRAQAYKWNRQENICALILSKDDWVGQNDNFLLSVAVLSDNFKLAARIMEKIGPSEAQEICYVEWPLFKEFRKSFDFLRVYEKIFQKKFVKVEQIPKKLEPVH